MGVGNITLTKIIVKIIMKSEISIRSRFQVDFIDKECTFVTLNIKQKVIIWKFQTF